MSERGIPATKVHKKRGLAQCDPETRKRVSSLGGKASHGGGRKPKVRTDG